MRIYKRPTDVPDKGDKPLKNWKFTSRDQEIVKAIPRYEGFLSLPQIYDLFFNNTEGGLSQSKKRIRLMSQSNGYLRRPNKEQRRELPEAIVWLNKKGMAFCEGEGVGFWQTLKRNGVDKDVWIAVKKPNFYRMRHDLMVNEFHLDVELACRGSDIDIVDWIPSYYFKRTGDKVTYIDKDGNQAIRKYEPDSYFVLQHGEHEKRFLLEIDRGDEGKEQIHRVLNEKILVFDAYRKSPVYADRFGKEAGRQLIVTSGKKRLENLVDMTANKLRKKAQFFLFTLFDDVDHQSVINEPIWWQYKDGKFSRVKLLDS